MHKADLSILIIEHDDPTRELYLRELKRDYCVFASSSAQEVFDLLHTHDIDAIVLEPSWPNGQGWQLLSAIQAINVQRAIPVIVCSTLDERVRGMELGASVYLVKPVLPQALRATLQRLLVSQDQL